MASKIIQDAYKKLGPYDYNPSPPPDHIVRTVKLLGLEDGSTYEGEVDEQDRPDGRGVKVF